MFGPFSFSHIAVLVVLVFVIYRWSRRNAVRARGSQAGGQNNGQGNAPRANAGQRPAEGDRGSGEMPVLWHLYRGWQQLRLRPGAPLKPRSAFLLPTHDK